MLTKPRILLHTEGAVVFLVSILSYRYIHASWLMFFLLLLAPDLFMLGYLLNVRVGATLYNAVHFYAGPLLLLTFPVLANRMFVLPYALIWIAHIGMDRMLGYGLKYPTQFKDTHLQHI
ncbi:MAG TPA: DUF4260 domain-containing protein [Candidatus Dormibacteraeota bacterium]|jgi:hypothetical protein|nr:DUF4260 domain-containing protein [Candidatus Dormibacteraeota bacterium]